MPAGCDFICKNETCDYFNTGFVMTSPWPMGKICLVISSEKVQKKEAILKKLIKQKDEGEKFACISLPNEEEIPIVAYRIQLWSEDAKCIWNYTVEATSQEEALDLIENEKTDVPSVCPKTGCKLLDFSEIIKKNICCPSCGEELTQSRWFSNEM